MTGGKSELSRRAFVAKLAGAAAVVGAAGIGTARAVTTQQQSEAESGGGHVAPAAQAAPPIAETNEPPAPAPWGLVAPLAQGSVVAHGWRVADLTAIVDGSCVLTLQNERGRAHRVHLCRNDGTPQGLVYTQRVDLVVMNGGRGDLATEEGFAQAVAEVAHVVAANEGAARHAALVGALLPQTERTERFASAAKLR
jgi:hypothetical protein